MQSTEVESFCSLSFLTWMAIFITSFLFGISFSKNDVYWALFYIGFLKSQDFCF